MKVIKYNKQTTDPIDELHDIVDKNDQVIGQAERIRFLENKNLIRRSCHIWLQNSKGKFWFQQRSKDKDLQPLHWSCSAAGFVGAGKNTKEEILEDAKRELKEELGVEANIKLAKIYLHQSDVVGGIMVYLYLGQHDGPFKFNREELADVKIFDFDQVWNLHQADKIKLTEPTIDELKYFLKL